MSQFDKRHISTYPKTSMEFKQNKGKEFNSETHYNQSVKNKVKEIILKAEREREEKKELDTYYKFIKRLIPDFLLKKKKPMEVRKQ